MSKRKDIKTIVREELQRTVATLAKEAHVRESMNSGLSSLVETVLEKITRQGGNRLSAYKAIMELLEKTGANSADVDGIRRWVESDWVNWFGEDAPRYSRSGTQLPDRARPVPPEEHWLGPREQ